MEGQFHESDQQVITQLCFSSGVVAWLQILILCYYHAPHSMQILNGLHCRIVTLVLRLQYLKLLTIVYFAFRLGSNLSTFRQNLNI